MKITKTKLIKLIRETFYAGPEGTVHLGSSPYEFLRNHPNPKIAKLAISSPAQAALLAKSIQSKNDPDFTGMLNYEDDIRDPKHNRGSTKGKQTTDTYAHMMKLYDNPGFIKSIEKEVANYVGDIDQYASDLVERYVEDEFTNVDTILELEAEHIAEHLSQERLYDMHISTYTDYKALDSQNKKIITDIIIDALKKIGVKSQLEWNIDAIDFGSPF